MFYSVFVPVYCLLALGNCLQDNGDCRSLEFKTTVEGSALFGHVVKSHVVNTLDDCELKCYLEAECMSVNFGPGDSGAYLCELSDSDHNLHPEDLKKRDGFIYRASENFCASNPCSLNSRCQTGFTDKGYRCICSVGFTGEDCSIEEQAWKSCQDILHSGRSVGDGEYMIDPEGDWNLLKVYCDMTTDGGGWLLIANLVISGSFPSSWSAKDDYRVIQNYHNNQMGISRSALKQLREHLSFTQLRFHCSKQQGHTFHVTTALNRTGEDVVQFFSGQTSDRPEACGSYVRMTDDNSQLAALCHKWGGGDGLWGKLDTMGRNQIYNQVAFVRGKLNWLIHISQKGSKNCDDSSNDQLLTGDFWKIFVR